MTNRVRVTGGGFEQVFTSQSTTQSITVEILRDSKLDSVSFRLIKERKKYGYKEAIYIRFI
jgi:hypothetical protein